MVVKKSAPGVFADECVSDIGITKAMLKRSLDDIINEIETNLRDGKRTSDAVILPALININERLKFLESEVVRAGRSWRGRDGDLGP